MSSVPLSRLNRLARFEREAKVLASLNHPNIGAIHGLEESVGIKALVLELVEGPTLADRISHGPIPIDEALPIAKQIAEALRHLRRMQPVTLGRSVEGRSLVVRASPWENPLATLPIIHLVHTHVLCQHWMWLLRYVIPFQKGSRVYSRQFHWRHNRAEKYGRAANLPVRARSRKVSVVTMHVSRRRFVRDTAAVTAAFLGLGRFLRAQGPGRGRGGLAIEATTLLQ